MQSLCPNISRWLVQSQPESLLGDIHWEAVQLTSLVSRITPPTTGPRVPTICSFICAFLTQQPELPYQTWGRRLLWTWLPSHSSHWHPSLPPKAASTTHQLDECQLRRFNMGLGCGGHSPDARKLQSSWEGAGKGKRLGSPWIPVALL